MTFLRTALGQAILTLIFAAGAVMAITFLVILLVPEPEPRAVSVGAIAAAYSAPEKAAAFGLEGVRLDDVTGVEADNDYSRNLLLEMTLAALLKRPVDDVRIFGTDVTAVTQIALGRGEGEAMVTAPAGSLEANRPRSSGGAVVPARRIGSLTLSTDGEGALDQVFDGFQAEFGTMAANIRDMDENDQFLKILAELETNSIDLAAIRDGDRGWVSFKRDEPFWTGWRLQALLAFGLSMIALLPLVWLAARRLSQPLRDLADLADGAQLDHNIEPVPLRGAAEIQSAASALFKMHQRLRADAAQRARVVAALAHDLRTPLTSLRVRIETAVSDSAREKMANDIRRMEAMIQDMMLYAKGVDKAPVQQRLDIQIIITACLEEARVLGAVDFSGLRHSLLVNGHSLSLHRAIGNLLSNALKYGSNARLSLAKEAGEVVITVSNDGASLSDADLIRLLEAFERGEESRNRDTGGAGLGLSIARDIAQYHQGSLMLRNRGSDGVDAVLRLPLSKLD